MLRVDRGRIEGFGLSLELSLHLLALLARLVFRKHRANLVSGKWVFFGLDGRLGDLVFAKCPALKRNDERVAVRPLEVVATQPVIALQRRCIDLEIAAAYFLHPA